MMSKTILFILTSDYPLAENKGVVSQTSLFTKDTNLMDYFLLIKLDFNEL